VTFEKLGVLGHEGVPVLKLGDTSSWLGSMGLAKDGGSGCEHEREDGKEVHSKTKEEEEKKRGWRGLGIREGQQNVRRDEAKIT
jgi:hypothetical protein